MADLPKLPGIPSISPVKDTTIAAILRPMKESLELIGGAITGNPLPNGTTITGGFNPVITNPGGGTTGYDPATDYTTPPTPTGLTISSGFSNILLSWNDPNTSGSFLNYAYTEIWRSPTNTLGSAVLQGFTVAAVYTDPVGTAKTYYYWIRFVSQANVAGPFNSSVGTIGGTGLVGGVDLSPLIITADKIASGAIDLGGAKVTGLLANANMAVITDPTKIADSLIGNTKLADLAVDAAKLASSSVTSTKIANLAVGTAAIQTGAITNALIANAAVGSAQIVDAAITSAKIGSLAVGSAAIQNAAIVNAKIADLAVDDAKIANLAVSKLTAGSINVGQYIQSTGYSSGVTGWYIGGNGSAEFGAASIRGLLTASQIDSRNLTIKDSSGTVLFGSGTNLDYSYVGGTKPPSDATRNRVYSSATQPTSGMAEGDLWNDTGTSPPAQWIYLSGAWRLTSTVGATFAAGYGQIAGQISSSNISTYIAGAAIGTAYIANAAITNALIANLAVTNAKIADLAVTNAKIDNLAVTTAKIDNLAVTSAKIGDAEVATLKIAGNAVTVPANGGGYSGVSINKSGFGTWQDFSEVYVDFGSISPSNVLILVTCNVLYSFGSGSTATYIRVIETVSGTTTLDNGITHTNSTLISIQAGMTGTFTGVRHFVVQLCQLTGGPSFYASNTSISVQGAKR